MGGAYRHHIWTDIAALDEHLTVFLKLDEALERFLEDFGPSSNERYTISTQSGLVERPSRAQISDAVDSLGGSLDKLGVWYGGPGGTRTSSLTTRPFPAYPLDRIGCALDVFGDDEIETNGRFDNLRNRMDAEIKRQFPPSNAANEETPQPAATVSSATSPATLPNAGGFKQWVGGVLRHPTGAQIVGQFVVLGVIALIGVLWKVYGG